MMVVSFHALGTKLASRNTCKSCVITPPSWVAHSFNIRPFSPYGPGASVDWRRLKIFFYTDGFRGVVVCDPILHIISAVEYGIESV